MKLSPALQPFAPSHNGYKLVIDNGAKGRKTAHQKSHPQSDDFVTPKKTTARKGSDTKSTCRKDKNWLNHSGAAARKSDHAQRHSEQNSNLHAFVETGFNPRIVLEAVRDALGRIRDFVITEANDAACSYNGLTREQYVGRSALELFPGNNDSGLFAMYCRTLESGEPLDLRNFRYRHDIHGEERVYDIRVIRVGDDLAYTWRDVTDHSVAGSDALHASFPVVLERRQNNHPPADFEAQIHEFQALARRLLEMREQEQQVISRELHDNIAQVLSAATARITLARQEPIPAWLRQELLDLRDQLKAALADVRTLARELRPSVLDHLGFTAALEKHADAFRERCRMTLEVSLVPEAVSFLEHGDLTHLFRLTQEALQNIEEHSGADKAWINLWEDDGAMQLEIGDNGRAFTPERVAEAQRDGHLGLLGMRERAELLGGNFLLEAVPGQGTVIRITIPPRKTRGANALEKES